MAATDETLLRRWREAFEAPVTGWDFSEFSGRLVEQQPPWSYQALAKEALLGAGSALDLGTGGGETLLQLREALPTDTIATEGWPPNIPVAGRNLAPHGIAVVPYDAEADARLPFDDARFDVVLDRHEAYVANEVLRVLSPGGRFLTQQVDGRDFHETQALFGGRSNYEHVNLDNFRTEASAAGFEVLAADQWRGQSWFADVSTLVRYFAYVPWNVPEDFTVDGYADQLLDLHRSARELTFTQGRFYLYLRRPR